MKDKAKGAVPYTVARKRLIDRMKELQAAGTTQLPGLRPLGKDIGVGPATLRRAIKHLALDQRIMIVPQKGHFISEVPACLNIGLILGDGATVSFLSAPYALNGILDALDEEDVYLRQIHTRSPERIPTLLSDYELDGCIWHLSDSKLFSKAALAIKNSSVPIIPVLHLEHSASEEAILPAFRVQPDFFGIGRLRAEFMLRRGHTKIACFTNPGIVYDAFLEAVSSAGALHKPAWSISKNDIFEKIPQILDEAEATALILNGGIPCMEKIFKALEDHPRGGELELLVDDAGAGLKKLLARYKAINIVAINRYPRKELGAAAARSLLAKLRENRPLKPIRILSQIELVDNKLTSILEDRNAS